MGPQAHKLHHRRTTVKRLWRNYEDLPKISGKSIEKTAGLNYTRHIRIFAAAGCWQNIQILDAASQAALGGKTALKGWYKALEDLVWLTQLGLNMLLPLVLCLAGCWWAVERCGSAKFLGVLQRAPGPLQKGKKSPGGLQLPPVMEGFFMKLEPESRKQLLRIAGGTAICTAAMWVLFAALHLVGWVRFDYTVVLASLVGAAVAIGNFAGICFVVQKIIDEPDEKKRKATLQLSYNSRMLLQAVWVVAAIAAPCFQPFAGVLPLFFPRVTIYYLQITGKYKPLAAPQEPVDVSVEDDPAPAPAQADGTRDEGGET